MSNKNPSLPAHKKPLMVALSVLAVSVVGSAREAGAVRALNCSQNIEFGTFASCGIANTATIAPDGGLSTSGCLSPVGGSLAGFCVLSEIAGTTLITVAGPGILTNGGGGNMVIDNFLLQVSGSPTPVPSITVSPSPSSTILTFGVGATLHIGAAQAGGTYTGTYTVNTNIP